MTVPSTAPDSSENLDSHDADSNVFERDAINDNGPDSKVELILKEVIPETKSGKDQIRTSESDLLPAKRKKAVRDKMNKALKDALPDFDL